MLVNLTIVWNDLELPPTVKQKVRVEETITSLIVFDSPTEYSKIPLGSIRYYDIQEVH